MTPVDQLTENLAALGQRAPALKDRLCLPVSNAQVRAGATGLERQHRGAWTSLHLDDAALSACVAAAGDAREVSLFGLGDGAQVLALLAARPDRTVTVWDRDPWLFRLFLSAHRLAEPLASGRLRLALTADLLELAAAFPASVWSHPAARVHYAPEWRLVQDQALGAAGAPFALVVTGTLFVDDLDDALRGEGHRTWPLDARLHAPEELALQVARTRPRVVAVINYLNGLAEFCEAQRVPLVSWEIDPTTDRLAPQRKPSKRAHLFTYRQAQVAEFRAAGFPHAEYLPLATNPARRRPPEASEEERERYLAPVAFVGASMQDQVPVHLQQLFRLVAAKCPPGADAGAELQRRLMGLLREQARDYSRHVIPERFADFFGDLGLSSGGPGLDPAQLVSELAAAEKRLAWVGALGSRGVHVWGDAGFRPLEQRGCTYRGPAGHAFELNKVYGHALVNVDIGRLYQMDIVTMRAFDVLACGGFLLSEWSDALPELFEVGRELETFRGVEELVAKVDHYLAHPDEARAIAERGRARVLKDHTIAQRVRHMLAAVETARG